MCICCDYCTNRIWCRIINGKCYGDCGIAFLNCCCRIIYC
jgi:hypothetical protein